MEVKVLDICEDEAKTLLLNIDPLSAYRPRANCAPG